MNRQTDPQEKRKKKMIQKIYYHIPSSTNEYRKEYRCEINPQA